MLYIVVYGFPFQLTDQYFQIRSLYVTSNLVLKGFLSKNLEQCVFFQNGGFHWVTFLVETPLISMDCYIVLSIVLSLDI